MRVHTRTTIAATALAALLLVTAAVAPATAAEPAPPVWDPTPASSTETPDYRVDFFLGTSTTAYLGGREYAAPSPVFKVEVENTSAVPMQIGLAMDLDVAGDLVPFWQPSTWQMLGDGFDGLTTSFVVTIAPGATWKNFDSGDDFSLPAWSGRTLGVYAVTEVAPVPPATEPAYTTGALLSSYTLPGRFVPVRFGDPAGYFNVGIGSATSVSAPDGELFPGVVATVTAPDLTAGDELQMYLVPDLDYFWFYVSMAALPVDAVPVGTGTVGPDGTFSGTFVVPSDLPLGDRYQLLLGDPADEYWPAGGYEYFAITEPSASASVSTPAGPSTATLPFAATQVTLDFPAGTTAGTTTAAVSTTGPAPSGFTLASDPPLYYHLDSTATPGGPVTVCITYDTANLPGTPPYLYHHEPAVPGGYTWTNITTSREPGKVCGVTTSFSPFALGVPDAPPDDGSLTVPALGVLSTDNGWDTGLKDGDYNVVMNLWSGENARIVRLLENGVLIGEQELTRNSPNAQKATFAVTGKANGTYTYVAELENSRGVTTTKPLAVKVTDASPGLPVLSDDNSDKNGSYVLTANMWWGTNGTSYTFREGTTVIGTGSLSAATPNAQKATVSVSGKPKGTYVYTVQFTNAAGSTTSKQLTVKVTR